MQFAQRLLSAVIAHVEVALFAVMELIIFPHAKVALPDIIEGGPFQRVLVVAGVQSNRPALKTKALLIFLLAVAASPLYDLVFVAASALSIVVLLACNVDHDMVGLTLFDHRPFFIHSDLFAVLKTVLTESGLAVRIIEVFL